MIRWRMSSWKWRENHAETSSEKAAIRDFQPLLLRCKEEQSEIKDGHDPVFCSVCASDCRSAGRDLYISLCQIMRSPGIGKSGMALFRDYGRYCNPAGCLRQHI